MKSAAESLLNIVVLLVVFALFIFVSPLFFVFYIQSYLYNKKFNKEYSQYLKVIDGARFFCYNNRRKGMDFIKENILPKLPDDINIVFLDGKGPKTASYERRFISEALYRIKDKKGFPYLLKVSNGKLFDRSINNAVHNTKHQGKDIQKLIDEIRRFFEDRPINPALIEFLTRKLGTPERSITLESSIEESYGIAGLDTIVLYNDFVSEFGIETPDDFDISNHITAEGISLLHELKRIFSKSYRERTRYIDLTIRNMENMMRERKWIVID